MTVLVLLLALQDAPAIDSSKVDLAVQKGVAWVKTAGVAPHVSGDQLKSPPDPLGSGWSCCRELVLLALWHAGVRQTDAFFAANLKMMLEEPPAYTYRTALQAMLLEAIDPARYQDRIRECAQVLVDNQCVNGQWAYGAPSPVDVPTAAPKKPKVETSGKPGAKPAIKKRRDGEKAGDNSNSQYAALGLRACRDAGVELPREVLERAAAAWGTLRQGSAWSYKIWGDRVETGSMTAGAVASLVIYDHLLGRDWTKDDDIARGVTWLVDHWSVTANPRPRDTGATGTTSQNALYYLYGIERLGRLTGKDRIGTHDWYAEGAKALLDTQKAGGSWSWEPGPAAATLQDTCFAILFLTRGTKGVVPSIDAKKNQ